MSELKRKAQQDEAKEDKSHICNTDGECAVCSTKGQRHDTKEDKRHKGNADVVSQLECAVCLTCPMFPPIRQCPNGHVLCDACSKKPSCAVCPQCRAHPTTIRCLALEKAAEGLVLNCSYAVNGCKKMFPYTKAEKHAKKCDFKPFKCPVKYAGTCEAMLQVQAEDICEHFIQHHNIVLEGEASEDAGGLLLQYKKDALHALGSRNKRCWKERLVGVKGMHFLVCAFEDDEAYRVSVKGLAADCELRYDFTFTVGEGRRKLIWKGPIHGLGNKTDGPNKIFPKDWAAKVHKHKGDTVLELLLTITVAS